ncbi:MAG TPA: Laminin subunit alpha-2 [Stenotrophomonas sp.]|nr:Laminin subunit alpha-2 [Stenotrophomonas sp.]
MADRLEEAIRVVIETQGREGIDELRLAFGDLGDVSVETAGKATKLLDSLTGLNAAADKTDAFEGMLEQLGELEREFGANQAAALALSLRIGEMEKPSREVLAAQRDLRKEGERLKKALDDQWQSVGKVDTELSSLGISTTDLAESQRRLRTEAVRAAEALSAQAKAAADEASSARRRKQQLQEADEAFRGQAQSSRAAAKSLSDYRNRAAEAADGSQDLAGATENAAGWFGKLKTLAAGAVAFVGLNRVVDGIKAIIKEGSDAEQEVAQLDAAIASAGRQAEFTATKLLALGKSLQTGLFDDGQVNSAMVRMLSYTNIVGEQFPAAMQITIDQAQRLGISLEQSAETVGKALQTPSKAMESLSKQGFTLSDSQKRLIKELEATGRVAEAQAIILDLLAESYGGAAAAAKVGTIAGLWKEATDRFKDWKQEVADQGVLTYFKEQLTTLLATLDRLAKDGTLTRWAKQTASAIITMTEVVKGATQWVVEHARIVGLLAVAYAQISLIQVIAQFRLWRGVLLAATQAQVANNVAMAASTKQVGLLGGAMRWLPKGPVPIAITLLGIEAAIGGLTVLRTFVDDVMRHNSSALEKAGEAQRAYINKVRDAGSELRSQAVSFSAYRDAVVKTSDEVAKLAEAERQAYLRRLSGLEQYLTAQEGYLLMQKRASIATAEELQELEKVTARLLEVSTGFAAMAKGAQTAADALKNGIGGAAQLVVQQLEGIEGNAKLAKDSIGKVFEGLNFVNTGSLEAVGAALGYVATQGAAAERNVRDGLLEALNRLSGEELARFQASAQSAFEALPEAAVNASAVLETTLLSAMQKLGVEASKLGVRFTGAGKDAIASFGAVTESAVATGAQIEAAFKAALGKVATLDEARTLGMLLESAGRQGKIGFDAAERSAAALNSRIRDIKTSIDPLADDFAKLGIQSQQALNAARDSAKAAFESIQRGAAQGKASVEDVRRAFRAYAEATRAAAADSDKWKRDTVESQLSVQESVFDTERSVEKLGETSDKAMRQLKEGADQGKGALDGVKDSADAAATNVERVGSNSGGAGQAMSQASGVASGFALNLGELSDAAMAALTSLRGLDQVRQLANVTNEIYAQRKALAAYRKDLQAAVAAEDELTAATTERLRERYGMLGDNELGEVARLEIELEQRRTERDRASAQAAQDRRKAAEAEAESQAKADAARLSSNGKSEQVLVIDWRFPNKQVTAAATAEQRQQAQVIADLVAPEILRRIERSRSISVRGRS